ncbi:MAG: hypothetical protein CMJ59_02145 [Planctomycetaceae bacterium]|nr:hypothetical protein [Planctomycetaceae bacterium]
MHVHSDRLTDRLGRQWIGGWLLVAAVWPIVVTGGQPAAAQQPQRARFFYNDDGDRAVFLLKGPFHRRQLHYPVDVLVGTGVTTLVFCANMGSDQAYYPSKVASSLGWREVENTRRNARYTYFNRLREIGEMLRTQKIDVLGTVMRRAQQQGLEFTPSLRMNDTHFLNKEPPLVHPLTGEFWMQNQELTIDGGALDFSHQKVRDYRLAQIRELIEGYATDGFEMDFSRQPTVFPAGTGHSKRGLVTEMVRQARRWLDAKSQRDGDRRFLIARVPHTLDLCQHYGFDLGSWMKENLVDYVVPASPDRYFQFDIPLGEFLELAGRTGSACRVIAGPDSYRATPSMYRAAMSNYYHMGQRDTYLFNFFTARADQREYYPFGDEDYALLRDLKSPVTLWGRPKHFMSAGWFPGRSLKLAEAARPYHVDLYVGDDLPLGRAENILKTAHLQMAVQGLPVEAALEVRLNGQLLPSDSAVRDGDQFRFELTRILPVRGPNRVSVMASRIEAPPTVTRMELLVDYDLRGVATEPAESGRGE